MLPHPCQLIEVTTEENKPKDVYNMQGVLLIRNADALQIGQLPRGIYIIGGKKVLIR